MATCIGPNNSYTALAWVYACMQRLAEPAMVSIIQADKYNTLNKTTFNDKLRSIRELTNTMVNIIYFHTY